MSEPSSLQKLHWIMAEQRHGPEAWRAAWLAAIDRAFPYTEADAHLEECRAKARERVRSTRG
jgi:hypothetical protein